MFKFRLVILLFVILATFDAVCVNGVMLRSANPSANPSPKPYLKYPDFIRTLISWYDGNNWLKSCLASVLKFMYNDATWDAYKKEPEQLESPLPAQPQQPLTQPERPSVAGPSGASGAAASSLLPPPGPIGAELSSGAGTSSDAMPTSSLVLTPKHAQKLYNLAGTFYNVYYDGYAFPKWSLDAMEPTSRGLDPYMEYSRVYYSNDLYNSSTGNRSNVDFSEEALILMASLREPVNMNTDMRMKRHYHSDQLSNFYTGLESNMGEDLFKNLVKPTIYDSPENLNTMSVKKANAESFKKKDKMVEGFYKERPNDRLKSKTAFYDQKLADVKMPYISIFTKTPMKNPKHGKNEESKVPINVLNLVGVAFDNVLQPDFQYFMDRDSGNYKLRENTKSQMGEFGFTDVQDLQNVVPQLVQYELDPSKRYELLQKFVTMLDMACNAAHDQNLTTIYMLDVGGGVFSNYLGPDIYNELKSEAIQQRLIEKQNGNGIFTCKAHSNITLKWGRPRNYYFHFHFDGSHAGSDNSSFYGSQKMSNSELEKALFVNAWDPWSMIGNGNAKDNSVDGWLGRMSAMALLGWPITNPKITYKNIYHNDIKGREV